MFRKNIRILGTGSFLSSNRVNNNDLEKSLGLAHGWIDKHCGVSTRYHIKDEEASEMGKEAALIAIKRAGIDLKDIDLVIGTSGTMQQAIPSMAALIHNKLGLVKTPTFDVNSTCLSFLSGLSIAAELIESKNYKNVLLVSADISSPGLNPKDPKTATLLGDGAAAVVVGPSKNSNSHIKGVAFETWSEAQNACVFEACGTKFLSKKPPKKEAHRQYFQMNGPRLFKVTLPYALKMMETLLTKANTTIKDMDVIIPHQASPSTLNIFQKKLQRKYGDLPGHFINIVKSFGNMIAVSIPHALDYAIQNSLLKRGDQCLMLGTSAGISLGGVLLEY